MPVLVGFFYGDSGNPYGGEGFFIDCLDLVGDSDGRFVGFTVGTEDVVAVWVLDGFVVGMGMVTCVFDLLGVVVLVGFAVGTYEGLLDGAKVGVSVGKEVGCSSDS